MELSVASLIQSGSYSPAKPERREISWKNSNGETNKAVVFIRKESFATAQAEARNYNLGVDWLTSRIVSSIVDEHGKPLFEVDDILGNDAHGPICDSLGYALIGAINEVNGIGLKPDPKALPPTTNSGTNSSSQALADEPSKKPSKTSRIEKSSTGSPTEQSSAP
ncbi:phage tail assembly chaperone family protein, TAC [Shewanella glacialipiscicola]|uniref:phage tail assembly chaperone family protein, TAC n=1 Tax=Shewanella glacialipiscicola TaxID=614069 RepID=UPI003D78FCEF